MFEDRTVERGHSITSHDVESVREAVEREVNSLEATYNCVADYSCETDCIGTNVRIMAIASRGANEQLIREAVKDIIFSVEGRLRPQEQ